MLVCDSLVCESRKLGMDYWPRFWTFDNRKGFSKVGGIVGDFGVRSKVDHDCRKSSSYGNNSRRSSTSIVSLVDIRKRIWRLSGIPIIVQYLGENDTKRAIIATYVFCADRTAYVVYIRDYGVGYQRLGPETMCLAATI